MIEKTNGFHYISHLYNQSNDLNPHYYLKLLKYIQWQIIWSIPVIMQNSNV